MVVAVGRGLLNIGAIYLYGEEPEYARGGHMAALMLKKYASYHKIVTTLLLQSLFFSFFQFSNLDINSGCGFLILLCVYHVFGKHCWKSLWYPW